MSDKTPENQPSAETGTPAAGAPSAPEGGARRPLQWGRPPSQVFHVGPLPKGPPIALAPRPQAQPPASAQSSPPISGAGSTVAPIRQGQPGARPAATGRGGIYSGSLIPRARPDKGFGTLPPVANPPVAKPFAPTPTPVPSLAEHPARKALAAAPRPAPAADPVVLPHAPAAPVEALAPAQAQSWPDTTVRPLPEAATPPRTVAPAPASAQVPPQAPALARTTARKSSGRLPLYLGAGVVVIAAIAAAVWVLRPKPAEPPAPVETAPVAAPVQPTVTPEPVPLDAGMVAETAAPVVQPAPTPAPVSTAARPAAPITTSPRPAATAPAGPAASAPRPATTPSTTPAAPPPQIVVAPLPTAPVAPPPTAARPQTNDPDAPITTRPQPLD